MPYFHGTDQSRLHSGTRSSLEDGPVYENIKSTVIKTTTMVIELEILTADTTMIISYVENHFFNKMLINN